MEMITVKRLARKESRALQVRRLYRHGNFRFPRRESQCVQHPSFHTLHPGRNVLEFSKTHPVVISHHGGILNSPDRDCGSLDPFSDLLSSSASHPGSQTGQPQFPISHRTPTEPILDLLEVFSGHRKLTLPLQSADTQVCKLGQSEFVQIQSAEILFVEIDELTTESVVRDAWDQNVIQCFEPGQAVQVSGTVKTHFRGVQDQMVDRFDLYGHQTIEKGT
jgi:hypothetical protein